MEQLKSLFRKKVLCQLDMTGELGDEELLEKIEQVIADGGSEHLLTLQQREELEKQIFNSFRKLDVLQELLEDSQITEIMVNGWEQIFYEKKGELFAWDKKFDSCETLENVVQQIAAWSNKTINEAEPIVDTRLKDGSRVNIVMEPAAVAGPCITIRKFFKDFMCLEKMVELGTLSQEMKELLEILVAAGYNIFVSGGTGSGKTTFLNALSQAIPSAERVITIEDSAELQLQGVKNLVRLEARMANVNGVGEITIRDLIRTSLRMRPTRIIVGEVRGPETLELLQANNTGHSGGMSTGHGNSCKDMLSRLETMVMMGMDIPLSAVRGQIASGFDIMIHLGRMRDRSRKVLEVSEILGVYEGEIQLNPLYVFDEKKDVGTKAAVDGVQTQRVQGNWLRAGRIQHLEKLKGAGLEDELRHVYEKKS